MQSYLRYLFKEPIHFREGMAVFGRQYSHLLHNNQEDSRLLIKKNVCCKWANRLLEKNKTEMTANFSWNPETVTEQIRITSWETSLNLWQWSQVDNCNKSQCKSKNHPVDNKKFSVYVHLNVSECPCLWKILLL